MKWIWITLCIAMQAMRVEGTSKADGSLSKFAVSPGKGLHMANRTKVMGMTPDQFKQLLWFFREEDPTHWNYSILALSFVALLSGLLVLGFNLMANRSKKVILRYQASAQMSKQAESPDLPVTKQALITLNQGESISFSDPQKTTMLHTFSKGEPRPGDIVVQWKDGNTTTLFTEGTEHEV